jgi:hypothetical protein
MLPRLEAERELADINAMSAAFGGMRRQDRQRHVGRLVRAANGRGSRAAQATPDVLAAMGISVVIVPAEGGANG